MDREYNLQTCSNCTLWSTNFIQYHFGKGSHMCQYNRKGRCALVADDICEELCLDECHTRYYNVDIKDKNKLLDTNPWNPEIRLRLKHNPLLDQTVEHSPEMSFISFVANMGGLIGMWLGLSAYAILQTGLNLL